VITLAVTALVALVTVAAGPAVAAPMCFGEAATVAGATAGDDVLNGTEGHDVFIGLGGNDTLNGLGGDDFICGGGGNDIVDGDDGNDKLKGGAGDDVIKGGPGDDTLAGGGGDDTGDYSNSSGIVADLASGTAEGEGSDALRDLEGLIGSVYNDTLTAAPAGSTLQGSGGTDMLVGGAGVDHLDGGELSDVLIGNGGADVIDGGAHDSDPDDTVDYSAAPSAVDVDLSSGTASGGGGADTLIDVENVTGSVYGDTLAGSDSWNVLRGLSGADILLGFAGDDVFYPGRGTDRVGGGADTSGDTLSYGDGSAVATVSVDLTTGSVTGGSGHDAIAGIENVEGSQFADTLRGDSGRNSIFGRGGNDTIQGRGRSDYLEGETGTDTIDGGRGNDFCSGEATFNCP
jgi:Ca2+-binding RTX toxin-like protein